MKDEYVEGLKKTWDELGKEDPFSAILDSRWDEEKAREFFETGAREIEEVIGYVKSLEERFSDVKVPRKLALDFGCGIGRLTQALAEHFEEVHGVDIASSMIERAREYNSHKDRCVYHLNVSDDLGIFPDNRFNFIYSSITLMHMEQGHARSYMRELLRVVAPGGLLIFQYLSEPKLKPGENENLGRSIKHLAKTKTPEVLLHLYRKVRYERIRQKTDKPVIEMYWMKRQKVERFLEKSGARVLDVIEDRTDWPGWISCKYCVTK